MNNTPSNCVISADEGAAFWQPGVKGNCITIKASPWNLAKPEHTVFMHDLPEDGTVGQHVHLDYEEIFVCLDGEGVMIIEGVEHVFAKHAVAVVAAGHVHSIKALSHQPLKFMVINSPPGLEERLKLMGIAKSSPDEQAPEAFTSTMLYMD
jgi:mannose-6-phosphate isomerase-like protein (cupin superfamily)